MFQTWLAFHSFHSVLLLHEALKLVLPDAWSNHLSISLTHPSSHFRNLLREVFLTSKTIINLDVFIWLSKRNGQFPKGENRAVCSRTQKAINKQGASPGYHGTTPQLSYLEDCFRKVNLSRSSNLTGIASALRYSCNYLISAHSTYLLLVHKLKSTINPSALMLLMWCVCFQEWQVCVFLHFAKRNEAHCLLSLSWTLVSLSRRINKNILHLILWFSLSQTSNNGSERDATWMTKECPELRIILLQNLKQHKR